MPTIFVSCEYSNDHVQRIVQKLRASKYRIWFDADEGAAVDAWQESAKMGLEQSSAIIVMIDPAVSSGERVKFQIREALQRGTIMVPLIMRPVSTEALDELGFRYSACIDFTHSNSWDAAMGQLLFTLRQNGIHVTRHELGRADTYRLHDDSLYESGLNEFLARFKSDDKLYRAALVYQQRLLENIRRSQRYGYTETIRADRAEIIDGLNDTGLSGLGITFSDFLKESSPAIERPPEHNMRGQYLRRLKRRIGFLNLSRISSAEKDVPLEEVYVPLPIEVSVSIEVRNYRIAKWWIKRDHDSDERQDLPLSLEDIFGPQVERAALDALIDQIQGFIDVGIDSQYSDAAERPLILAPPWYDGLKSSFWQLYAEDAAAVLSRVVVLGPPGSGKSTFARHLALSLADAQLSPSFPQTSVSTLGQWPHGALTPVYIELRQFVGWEKFPKLGESVTEDHFTKYVQEELLGNSLAEFASQLEKDLLAGQAIVIMDGLDEIPIPSGETSAHQRHKQLQELARSLGEVYPDCRIVFTSRDYGYRGWELDGFTAVRLAAFNAKQIRQLAINLYHEKGVKGNEAIAQADTLVRALDGIPDSLKDRPLFITLLATIFLTRGKEGWPSSKGELYHESIMLLLDRWTQPRLEEPSLAKQIGCSVEQLYQRLEVVAYHTQAKADAAESLSSQIDFGLLLRELFRLGPSADLRKTLAFLSQQSGVLMSPAPEYYQFAHRSFQEYLAASHMVRQSDFSEVRRVIEHQPLIWRETCLLVGDILARTDRQSDIWDLLEALLGDAHGGIQDRHCWSIWLAGRSVLDQGIHLTQISRRNQPIYDDLREHLGLVVSKQCNLPVTERAECGDILGLVGDTRFGIGVTDGLPEIDWCTIPAGVFQMGVTEEQQQLILSKDWGKGWKFTRETPSALVPLPEFQISRYTITQQQFQVFVDALDGYYNPEWWTRAGRKWFEENKIEGPASLDWGNHPNFPRTNTSWYEAVAFCNWLGARLRRHIRLPSEAEWEKAARGVDERCFPWGNDFDASHCNAEKTGLGKACAVGCFPLQEGPWGENSPLDMSGNVWEWCTTICEKDQGPVFQYPYRIDERENIELGSDYLRIVRGGCYLSVPFVVRTTFRGRDKPFSRFGRQGFRIVSVL